MERQKPLSLDEMTALVGKVSKWMRGEPEFYDEIRGVAGGVMIEFSADIAGDGKNAGYFPSIWVYELDSGITLGEADSRDNPRVIDIYNQVDKVAVPRIVGRWSAIARARQLLAQ